MRWAWTLSRASTKVREGEGADERAWARVLAGVCPLPCMVSWHRSYTRRVDRHRVQLASSATTMSKNILDPSALISALQNVLPPTRKRLESPQDGLAALIHTVMVSLGFRLVGVDESSPARSILNSVLPDEWNQHGPGNYTFKYKHEQSSLEFVVKVVKLGSRTLINSIAVEVRYCLVENILWTDALANRATRQLRSTFLQMTSYHRRSSRTTPQLLMLSLLYMASFLQIELPTSCRSFNSPQYKN